LQKVNDGFVARIVVWRIVCDAISDDYSAVVCHAERCAAAERDRQREFSSCATDLPVLSRCGEFLVRYGPSYCVLESSKMTLEQLRAVLASGELFHVAAGEVVWNALLAADNGADDDDAMMERR
jgi:hypothetical protein